MLITNRITIVGPNYRPQFRSRKVRSYPSYPAEHPSKSIPLFRAYRSFGTAQATRHLLGCLPGTTELNLEVTERGASQVVDMVYTLVALDLDGTTLNTDHELSPLTKSTLRQLCADGVMVSIATGRSINAIRPVVKELALPVEMPVVCFNGACGVMCRSDGTSSDLFSTSLSLEATKAVLELAAQLGLMAQYYVGDDVFAAPTCEAHHELLQKYATLTGHPQTIVDTYDTLLSTLPSKILILGPSPDVILDAAGSSQGLADVHLIRGSPDPFFVEFLPPGVCKGAPRTGRGNLGDPAGTRPCGDSTLRELHRNWVSSAIYFPFALPGL
ncbi:hypothetical protein CYMTET_30898 [Cymbomonas tetramitiformis]|uniref:Uncharacterized protein n=1 Tax=Cymbomonas tetramitiformis TaxID=36881 RepID=A0AAE0KTF8_9CHLO|nr:hypothetical protein CYMTET_30898 [Cymbomonas tetramitiformis]